MSVCKYLRELFLFSRLFGSQDRANDTCVGADSDRRTLSWDDENDGGNDRQSLDDFLDEQEEYDMLDDF